MISVASQLHVLLLVLIATFFGAIIGLERERSNKPAGARTQSLVAGACALVVGAGAVVDQIYGLGDPTRAMHAVITGIGFLGAGIMTGAGEWAGRGITTATTVFTTAGIGAVVGLNMPITGFGATIIVLVALRLSRVIKKVRRNDMDEPVITETKVSDDWPDSES